MSTRNSKPQERKDPNPQERREAAAEPTDPVPPKPPTTKSELPEGWQPLDHDVVVWGNI